MFAYMGTWPTAANDEIRIPKRGLNTKTRRHQGQLFYCATRLGGTGANTTAEARRIRTQTPQIAQMDADLRTTFN